MYSKKQIYRVMTVSAGTKTADYFSDILPRGHYEIMATASSAGEARRIFADNPADIVIINAPLPDDFGVNLAIDMADESTSGVMLLVKNELYEQVANKVEEHGILTLPRPNSRQAVLQAVQLLAATRARLKKYEDKAQDLQSRMEDIRLINRAKLLLMERLNMTEQQAHRFVEKSAMDHSIKRREVAEKIISMYD